MLFALALSVNEDVIEVHYHKNIKLLYQDLVDIALEHDWCIGQSERHDLVLKMAIAGPKSHLLFISFFNPHSMVSIGQIKLGELSSSA